MNSSSVGTNVYDEEFNRNLGIARKLISQLPRRHDREIVTKWIGRLCELKSNDPIVKKNRNQFFQYMLTVVHRGVYDQPDPHHGYPQVHPKYGALGDKLHGKKFMSRWSGDRRTYVAVMPLPGRGALVYMAVSKRPELGWEFHR